MISVGLLLGSTEEKYAALEQLKADSEKASKHNCTALGHLTEPPCHVIAARESEFSNILSIANCFGER